MIRKHILEEIKNVALKHIGEAEVMLFGSRAKGSGAEDSDYDVLIITGNKIPPDQKMPEN